MDNLINKIFQDAIQPFLTFLVALAFVVFVYGIIEFIYGADNEEKRRKGRSHIMWGLIGLFIMFSAYGIKAIIQNFVNSF